MNKIFLNNINDLVELQRASFLHFLYKDIKNELKNIPNPYIIINNNNKKKSKKRNNIANISNIIPFFTFFFIY